MRAALVPISLFLSFASASVLHPASQSQHILGATNVDISEANIHRVLAAHDNDPVEIMRLLDPAYAATLDEPRLLEVFGAEPVWMTEGDKLRLRKQGLSFMDLTGREDIFRSTVSTSDKQTGMSFLPTRAPRSSITEPVTVEWPELRYQDKVNEIAQSLKKEEMVYNLGNLTSFFNRYYRSDYGVQSSRWIYDKLLEVGLPGPPSGSVFDRVLDRRRRASRRACLSREVHTFLSPTDRDCSV